MHDKALILGSGGLTIGQAGEFDYSGSQALKALQEEGVTTVLVNPNIATIQTSKGFSDEVYFVPVTPLFVKKVIEKERPDSILVSFGGQTALNCGIDLYTSGIFQKYHVDVIGTSIENIIATEDKGTFARTLSSLGIKIPFSLSVSTVDEGMRAAERIGFPLLLRTGFALGGLASGLCLTPEDLQPLLLQALAHSPQVLLEESLVGWKEVEYEVIRDSYDNCITVCNMENMDPMGIHTGESIVVAPSQTLSDDEYQKLRALSLKIARHFSIIGECNVQFALNHDSDEYRVIEVNARLSRSSALASKATGYPIAFIAAKLGLGYNLIDIPNPVTGITTAMVEPALDYIAVKMPRWDSRKFKTIDNHIGSSMKSVGEVMAIGRKFEEAIQKAVRMIDPSFSGLTEDVLIEDLENELIHPTDKRIFALVTAFSKGLTVERVSELTHIDKWFLSKIKAIVDMHEHLQTERLTPDLLKRAKEYGFSDRQIAHSQKRKELQENEIRAMRHRYGIIPVIKQIDTLAAEYPCKTAYLYVTYNAQTDDIPLHQKGVLVIGSGPYSIGSSVEFDWCCVHCVKTLKAQNVKTIVINCNPETVSTDYDECDRLYFEELTSERVLDIYEKEAPDGIILSMGGQIPNSLAHQLSSAGVTILGTPPHVIDSVEDRHTFSTLLDKLGIDQPQWKTLTTLEEVKAFCDQVGYPVLIRPSYVLSGAAMNIAYEETDLEQLLSAAKAVSPAHPVVVTKFITDAREVDMDMVVQKGQIIAWALSEHVENAGVHSGDATLVTPAQRLCLETIAKIRKISESVVSHLDHTGPVNIQVIVKGDEVKVIECNLRASRSIPFVSKVYNTNFIELATRAILGCPLEKVDMKAFDRRYVGVKAPLFSFTRLRGTDPHLGVEMASTGEVACFGEDLQEAFLKAMVSAGVTIPEKILLSTGDIQQKVQLLDSVRKLDKGFVLYGTPGTAGFYKEHNINLEVLPVEGGGDSNVLNYIRKKGIDLVINIPKRDNPGASTGYSIRRVAADFSVPLITDVQCAILFADAISRYTEDDLKPLRWSEYMNRLIL
ncbi:MAG: carbamoyl-phosphate synthase (glutamine-hydrolyzing) large subunit [Theionarchaea archaeon]|nr:carbamoyl-phosphate synthase (glutamine-hydrolyzing) large subunit [Theionarchaea archaeon]MBU7020559.1 carbamoyl-phosphate synthase (glutamine-hydrolyzing) large subunit [Theionarchaea archaeon]MBU7034174.1 carbamoyl-phosphate synthase (glutamine-hydrolyzing) large subunit [Theionarchaea archaeon]MBU7039282.1 carbamoyl-phosphate synthase (glutamine-hydrolyzing) large subunit [Theionarchaea archaeon]